MRLYTCLFFAIIFLCSCSREIFVVRHGEKAAASGNGAMMSNDPPLNEAGQQRATDLKNILASKKIGHIFSTNTIRTRSTAEPTRAHFGLTIETYSPQPGDAFVSKINALKKNTLIVGHSNTVDDIVNRICGERKIPGDLDESIYDNLFILRKKGKKWVFENRKFGRPTP